MFNRLHRARPSLSSLKISHTPSEPPDFWNWTASIGPRRHEIPLQKSINIPARIPPSTIVPARTKALSSGSSKALLTWNCGIVRHDQDVFLLFQAERTTAIHAS